MPLRVTVLATAPVLRLRTVFAPCPMLPLMVILPVGVSCSVMVVAVESIYFQCSRAILRSDLWNPAKQVDAKSLPTPGKILAALSEERIGGEAYDKAWPQRAKESMW